MTALIDTLFMMESFLGIETDSLLPFAEADNIGGYNADATKAKWHIGSIWEVEGQTLYALVRSLKPNVVVELGSFYGCSTSHIAAAVRENGIGTFTAVDKAAMGDISAINGVNAVRADAFEWLEGQKDHSIDFLFEDLFHTEEDCYRIGILAQQKLKPGGVLVAHDAAHYIVGVHVRKGYERAGLKFRVYLTEPSDCGLMVAIPNPKSDTQSASTVENKPKRKQKKAQ